MPNRTMMIDGVRVPRFFYGTAWKEDETTRLTALALGQGFRGIDTRISVNTITKPGSGAASGRR